MISLKKSVGGSDQASDSEHMYAQAEFREADFFPVEIFPNPNTDSDSVKNSESHDIKFLT